LHFLPRGLTLALYGRRNARAGADGESLSELAAEVAARAAGGEMLSFTARAARQRLAARARAHNRKRAPV
jgi:hypothetical protein